MKVVVDTNVLVAGLLNPAGPPGRVIDLVLNREVTACFDDRILAEYRAVLLRPAFAFEPSDVEALLDYMKSTGSHVVATPLPVVLPDPDDGKFLEAALAAGAERLITGNIRHFLPKRRHGVRVVEPREFATEWVSGTSSNRVSEGNLTGRETVAGFRSSRCPAGRRPRNRCRGPGRDRSTRLREEAGPDPRS